MWRRGQRRPPASLVSVLRHRLERDRASDDLQLVVVVWHGLGRDTPQTPADRADFAAFAAALVTALPQVRYVIVGNEPNLSTLLEAAVRRRRQRPRRSRRTPTCSRAATTRSRPSRPTCRCSAARSRRAAATGPAARRPTHSPTAFIRDLGAAYRASGRTKPLMDAFAFHPYMEASEDLAERRAPAEHDDHARRLPEAGRAARRRPSTAPPSRARAAGLLHRVRRPDARAGARSAGFYTNLELAGAHRQRLVRRRRPPTTARALAARLLPADRPRALPLPHLRRGRTSAAGSRASTSPTARRSRACRPSSATVADLRNGRLRRCPR